MVRVNSLPLAWTFVLVLVAAAPRGQDASPAESINQAGVEGPAAELEGLSPAELIAVVVSADEARAEAALDELIPDAGSVLRHFDLLVDAARTARGELIFRKMAEAIRESPLGPDKQRAIDQFTEYLDRVMQAGHPTVSRDALLRCIVGSIYYYSEPFGSFVRPSYGVESMRQALTRYLNDRDFHVRREAVLALSFIGFVNSEIAEEVIPLIERQRRKEETAADYPGDDVYEREKTLSKICDALEALNRAVNYRNMRDFSSLRISDEEYAALLRMPDEELLEKVRRPGPGPTGSVALRRLMEKPLTMERMEQLAAIGLEGGFGKGGSDTLNVVACALATPVKRGEATDEHRRVITRFVQLMETTPNFATIIALSKIAFAGGGGPSAVMLGPSTYEDVDPAFREGLEALIRCLDLLPNPAGIVSLLDSAAFVPAYRERVLEALRARREKELQLPDHEKKQEILSAIDRTIRDIEFRLNDPKYDKMLRESLNPPPASPEH